MDKITVKDIDVRYKKIDTGDFICLTDIAKYKNPEDPRFIVYSWLRNKNTIVFLVYAKHTPWCQSSEMT